MSIEVDRLVQPVSDEESSGPDLEYDSVFQQMIEASRGKPERVMGDSVQPAEDPEWRVVRECANELLTRTRDVRVLVHLAAAEAALEGIRGVGSVIDALRILLSTHWETVHPELDREDNDDPTMRFNALLGLCDPDGLLKTVRDATLVAARGIGEFSLRAIQVAQGHTPHVGEGEPPSAALVDGAFLEFPIEDLQANAESVETAIAALDSIDADLVARVAAGMTPDLSPLRNLLAEAQTVLAEQLDRRGASTSAGSDTLAAAGGPDAAPAVAGEVRSREDVLRALDRICDFYQKHEPSSPIPLLLKRAKRLVDKSFVEILQDLAPGGMSEVETIGGLDTEQ